MKNISMKAKLLIFFLAVGVLPFAVVGGMSLYKSSNALSDLAYGQLEGMRGVKKAQIENFFAERQGDMGVRPLPSWKPSRRSKRPSLPTISKS